MVPVTIISYVLARLGVSRPIYVAVDSPNLGFPYFNFLRGYQLKNTLYVKKRCNKTFPCTDHIQSFLTPDPRWHPIATEG